MHQHGIVPYVRTYNALISALGKGKRPEQALEYFQENAATWYCADVIIYNAPISALEKGKQPERALGGFPRECSSMT